MKMRLTLDSLREQFDLSDEVYKSFRQVEKRIPELHEIGNSLMRERLNGNGNISLLDALATGESGVEKRMDNMIRSMREYLDFQEQRLLEEGFDGGELKRQFDLGRKYISHVMVPDKHRVNLIQPQTLGDLNLDPGVYDIFNEVDIEVSWIYIDPRLSYRGKVIKFCETFGLLKDAISKLDLSSYDVHERKKLERQIDRGMDYYKGRVDYFTSSLENAA